MIEPAHGSMATLPENAWHTAPRGNNNSQQSTTITQKFKILKVPLSDKSFSKHLQLLNLPGFLFLVRKYAILPIPMSSIVMLQPAYGGLFRGAPPHCVGPARWPGSRSSSWPLWRENEAAAPGASSQPPLRASWAVSPWVNPLVSHGLPLVCWKKSWGVDDGG